MTATATRMSVQDRLYYTVSDLGRSRAITPEGFTVCKDVAIARVGAQLYAPDECPMIDPGGRGHITINRTPDEVFRQETMASFEGKPVTIDHPSGFVNPQTWGDLAVGVVQNVRRGEGLDADLLIADLLITREDAITYVNEDKPDLSAGYDAEYVQTEPGQGIQRNIIGNHVALVDRGRAGRRVAIKDQESPIMSNGKKSFVDRLKELAGLTSESEARAAVRALVRDADPDDDTTSSMDARMRDAENFMKECRDRFKAQDEEKAEEKRKQEAKDKAIRDAGDLTEPHGAEKVNIGVVYTGDGWPEITSRAEILSPGIKIPTTDAVKTVGTLKKFMVQAVTDAAAKHEGVKALVADRDLTKLTGDAVLGVFHAASELVRATNNKGSERGGIRTRDSSKAVTPASINEANAKFWADRKLA